MSTETSPLPAGRPRTARVVDAAGTVFVESDVPEGVHPWWATRRDLVCLLDGPDGNCFAAQRLPEGVHTPGAAWLEFVDAPASPSVDLMGPLKASLGIPCAVREERAAMTDEEYDADVAESLQRGGWYGDVEVFDQPSVHDDEPLVEVPFSAGSPCTECGATAACGYDSEGRPMIHLQARDE